MNERISKIAQETDAWCDQHYSGEDSYDIEWEKKFAELLVFDVLNELTNDDNLGPARIETIRQLAQRYGVAR
jgi:hypothetical protein